MIYGCPVWGLRLPLLLSDNIPNSVQHLLTTYRHLQRTLLHLTRDVRCEILTVITARPPLDILLRKIIWRYYHRLHSADPPPTSSPSSAHGHVPWMMNRTAPTTDLPKAAAI